MNTPTIKTRFAPSPTGLIHLGNARTALFNALYAYRHQGTLLLRIEDTDLERSQTEYVQQLMTDLHWLDLNWHEGPQVGGDNGPYYQSERNEIYAHYYALLEQQDAVYPCFCTPSELALARKLQRTAGQAPRYAGTCAYLSQAEIAAKLEQGLKPTLRFRVPRGQKIEFLDLVKGQQQFATDDIGDFIIRRADGTPAFFFCNAIDDALMGVTHVFRGDDHLTNTPRQIMMLQALGLTIPQYGHIALIVGDDGTPLSKRNGSQSIQELRENGWLAEGVVNYLARLGHTYSEESYLSLTELANHFAVERLGRAPAHFDEQQLRHWQQMAVLQASATRLWDWIGQTVAAQVPHDLQTQFIAAIRSNMTYPHEALHWAKILFSDELIFSPEAQTVLAKAGSDFFHQAIVTLATTQGNYPEWVKQLKQATGTQGKNLFMPLRAALTGEVHGPEMANLLPLIGLERARRRLQANIMG
ncbi:glutamyl-tRNA synthetase [Thioploca ingrica]|uniref:Glutamate--tRNA ligase n=1 Tax=Thioploca ingrica TaxID=40754 RepID=A0A090ABY0_9GAMM|nr:glutamyl-tRNA synthetase [Thioploca ingrica]